MGKSEHIKSTLGYTVCAATKEVTFISENLRAKLTAEIKTSVYACVLESGYFVYLIKHDGHSRPLSHSPSARDLEDLLAQGRSLVGR